MKDLFYFFLNQQSSKAKVDFFSSLDFPPFLPFPVSSLPIPIVIIDLSESIQSPLRGKTLALTAHTTIVLFH